MRLRSWGETSEASAGMIDPSRDPEQRNHGTERDHMNDVDHTWRPARFMVIAAHPDDADFGPAGTAARWIDAGSDGLAGVLHERRPGRRGSRRRSARAGRPPRERAAGGRRPSSATPGSRSSTSPTARSSTTSPCASSSSARSGPSGPDAVLATDPTVVFYRDGGINHTDHRAAGMAAVDAVYPAARNPMAFPCARPARAGRPSGPPPVPVLVRTSRTSGSTSRPRSTARSRRCARTPARSTSRRSWPSGSGAGPPRRASRSGRRRPRRSG